MFDVGTEMFMHHKQHLSTSHITMIRCFSLFVGVNLSRKITCENIGECGQQFGIQCSELAYITKSPNCLAFFPGLTYPIKCVVRVSGCRHYSFPCTDSPISVRFRMGKGWNFHSVGFFDLVLFM